MKPSWKDAPEWAQWLAMDKAGNWFWFQREPEVMPDGMLRRNFGLQIFAGETIGQVILEPRP